MKALFLVVLFCATFSYGEVITGWVSEENCKEQHAEPGGKDCVKKCLRGGEHVGHPEWTAQKMMFVQEPDRKTWMVQNPDLLRSYAGERILLSATLKPETNTLEAVEVQPYHQPVPFHRFHFRNGFWINLHHFLRGQARRELHPESKNEVSLVVHLTENEKKDWQEALEYYKVNFAEKDLYFDEELWPVKNWLGDAENNPDLPPNENVALAVILKKAEPVYRKHWWPEHEKSNDEWIAVAQRLLDQFGSRIDKSMSQFYEAWPENFLVDVTIEAGWAGAYTTDHPVRITCSSAESRMQDYAALEILFHEASHARDSWLSDRIESAAKAKEQVPDKRFWHAVLFYTAGKFTKKELEAVGIHYIPFFQKNKLYLSEWTAAKCALENQWEPQMNDTQWQKLIDELKRCSE